jgi:transposase-like protein
LDTE